MDRVNVAAATDWIELVVIVLVALGLGAAVGSVWLGPAVLGLGVWLFVTGVLLMAGSVGLTWHNARNNSEREVGR
jgi:hypothetical protein